MTKTPDILKKLHLSEVQEGRRLLNVYGSWYERYPQYARASLNQSSWFDGTWFELLIHELLTQLGFEVEVKDIDSLRRSPDFLARKNDRRCYVEVTTVDPEGNPLRVDPNLKEAIRKLNTLHSSDFQIALTIEGKIDRTLSERELDESFGRLLNENDPVMVQRQVCTMGEWAAPQTEIKGDDWILRGRLRPIPTTEEQSDRPRQLIVGLSGISEGDGSGMVRKAVVKKAGHYGRLDAPLIVAVNVLDSRFDREAEMATLFGEEQIEYFPDHAEVPDRLVRKPDGVWVKGGYQPRYTRLAGVLFFHSFFPWSPGGSVCLYVNPYLDNPDLPQALYRLPHVKREDGHIRRIEGEDTEILLGIK